MKKVTLGALLLLSGVCFVAIKHVDVIHRHAQEKVYAMKSEIRQEMNKILLKEAIQKGLVNMNATPAEFHPYYSKDYIQNVDGKTLNYAEFLAHMDDLHKTLESLKIEFLDMLAEGDKVATRHIAHATKKDGKKVEVLVVAVFGFQAGKIISCDELTHLVKGEGKDRDIGSRH